MEKKDNTELQLNSGNKKIRISVRNLVEFVFRSGNIDNRKTSSADMNAMQEGSRLHRKIQESMDENYYPEVLLNYKYDTGEYTIDIEGRADGIISEKDDEFEQVTIDEIKCVAKGLEYITEPVYVHLAQAKVYAFIYSQQKKLPLIRVRMTYCNIETEEIKYFFEEYTSAELNEWFLFDTVHKTVLLLNKPVPSNPDTGYVY